MGRFLAGALGALAACAGVYWFVLRAPVGEEPCGGMCGRGTVCEGARCVAAPTASAAPDATEPRGRTRRRRGPGRASGGPAGSPDAPIDDSSISDDMDLGPQEVDMDPSAAGGEGQLATATIESVMGKNFGSIRRCIFIAQSEREEHVRGRMSIGIRIRPSGQVGAVTVRPPGALATGELVPCVRTAVSRIRFPAFDGREMAVTYPVTLD